MNSKLKQEHDLSSSTSISCRAFVCSKCTDIFDGRKELNNHLKKDCCLHDKKQQSTKWKIINGIPIKLPKVNIRRLHNINLHQTVKLPPKTELDIQDKGKKLLPTRKIIEKHFRCNICRKTFKYTRNLNYHVKYMHHTPLSFKCDFCEKKFCYKKDCNNHVRFIHENPLTYFICNICEKKFSRKENLDKHAKSVHENSLSLKCNFCNSFFTKSKNLNYHIVQRHTKVRRFKCNNCDYGANRKLLYLNHIKNCSENSEHKFGNYQKSISREVRCYCPFCGVVFSTILSMVKHMKTHTEVDCPEKYPEKIKIRPERSEVAKTYPKKGKEKKAKVKHNAGIHGAMAYQDFNLIDDEMETKEDIVKAPTPTDNVNDMISCEPPPHSPEELEQEDQLLTIVGELMNCLNVKSADCDRVIQLLDDLNNLQLNVTILKKHPAIIFTVTKLTKYIGNMPNRSITAEDKVHFKSKALKIRKKSFEMYQKCSELLPFKLQRFKISGSLLISYCQTSQTLSLPDLTDEMKTIIDEAIRVGVGPGTGIGITREDIKTLAPCGWLNDNVINGYMELIVNRSRNGNGKYPKCHIFSSFFYTKYLNVGYSYSLKLHTRKRDIFEYDFLMFPIHLGTHWCLAVADLRNKSLKYYNSLKGGNLNCLRDILQYMSLEMKDRKNKVLETSKWSLKNVQDVPQQENKNDCGMFVCKIAECLSREATLDSVIQQNMNYYRKLMIYELLKRELISP